MPTLSRGAEHTFGPSYRSLPTPGARPNQSNPPAAARPVTDTHAAHRDPDGSDTEATGDDEAMCAGGSGRYSQSKHFLPHAIRHFVRQLMFGGHHAFYDTCLSEYTHQSVVKWAGSRVRMRGHNQTHDDMGRLVWEDAILAAVGASHVPPKRAYFRRAFVGGVRIGRPVLHTAQRLNSFVSTHIPITWGEACSFMSSLLGTRRERARGAVTAERAHLLGLTWTWSLNSTVLRNGCDSTFAAGDVVRFRGTEGIPATALVGQVDTLAHFTFCRQRSVDRVL